MSPWDQMPVGGMPPPGIPMGGMPPGMPPQMPPMGPMDFPNTQGVGQYQQIEQALNAQKSEMSDISLEQATLKHEKEALGQSTQLMQKLMGKMKEGM